MKTRTAHGGPPPGSGVALLATTPGSAAGATSAGSSSGRWSGPRRSSARSATATPPNETSAAERDEQPLAPAPAPQPRLRDARLDLVVARGRAAQLVAQVVEHGGRSPLMRPPTRRGPVAEEALHRLQAARDPRADDIRGRLELGRDLRIIALLEDARADRGRLVGPHGVERLGEPPAQAVEAGLAMQVLDVLGAEARALQAEPRDGRLLDAPLRQ